MSRSFTHSGIYLGRQTRHRPPPVASEEPWLREPGREKAWLCESAQLLPKPTFDRYHLPPHWVVVRTNSTYKTAVSEKQQCPKQ